jgi:hypothetical protein
LALVRGDRHPARAIFVLRGGVPAPGRAQPDRHQRLGVRPGLRSDKGLAWGTLSTRIAAKYERVEGKVEPGEYAIEYLRRVSPAWRLVASVEGEDDEISLIGESQWRLSRTAFLELNCGFGLTNKAPDIAPGVGVMFSF